VAPDGCVRGESAQRLGFGREAKKNSAVSRAHTHVRMHAWFPHPMLINKAQGQTLKMVSIFLPKPVFTHGQLYVTMSRIGCPKGVKLLDTDGWEDAHEDAPAGVYTRNVVYTEVL